MKTKAISQDWLSELHHRTQDDDHFRSQLPAVVNGVTLVTGGVRWQFLDLALFLHSHFSEGLCWSRVRIYVSTI